MIKIDIMESRELFLEAFQGLFDETPSNEIQFETEFKEIKEWSSLTALATIVMFEEQFNTGVNARQIDDAKTVEDLYNITLTPNS
jgi:acyl carrier protein